VIVVILREKLDSAEWARVIRLLRNQKEWPQRELAEKLGVHAQAISEVERGNERLTLERLNRILDALGYKGEIKISKKKDKLAASWGTINSRDPSLRRIIEWARELAEEMAGYLYKEFDVDAVYCIGSLAAAQGGRFKKKSDIDLVVEGLDAGEFISARSELEVKVLDFLPKKRRHSFDLIRSDGYKGNIKKLLSENQAVLIPRAIENNVEK
jgi:transcriptional regulator with XRE-family HTH domain